MYSQNPNVGNGWTRDGEVFNVYDYQYKGPQANPIYQYHADTNGEWRFLLSLDPNVGNGWTKDGIAFYGFNAPSAGRKQVYQFHAVNQAGGYRYLYALGSTPSPGWTLDGVAFYAYGIID